MGGKMTEVPWTKDELKEVKRRISEAVIILLSDYPFLGNLVMRLKPEPILLPTAGVDPKGRMAYNPLWFKELSDSEILTVMAHEVLHMALMFWPRFATLGPDANLLKANVAHDYIINGHLKKMGFVLVPKSYYKRAYDKYFFEELYWELEDDELPDMDCWGDCWGIGPDILGGGAFTPDEIRKFQITWSQAVAGAKQAQDKSKMGWGSLPDSLRIEIEGILTPEIPWAEKLSRWGGDRGRRDTRSYRRPARRKVEGVILPSMRANKPSVWALIDTSGSMVGELLRKVVSEIVGAFDSLGHISGVMTCDAQVQAVVEDPENVDEILEVLQGGGGSSFIPAFEALAEMNHQGPVVVGTDGQITVPEYPPDGMDVVWLIPEHRWCQIPADWGDVIRVSVEDA